MKHFMLVALLFATEIGFSADLKTVLTKPIILGASVSAGHGTAGEIAEALRRLHPGIVIARAGGTAVSRDRGTADVLSVLRCPLFLVR